MKPPTKKKKPNRYANNSRCNAWMKDLGWKIWNTQSFNHFTFKKLDLFNLWDKVAMGYWGEDDHDLHLIGVQLTDAGHLAEHIRKMQENEYLDMWKKTGNLALILWSVKVDGHWEVRQKWL